MELSSKLVQTSGIHWIVSFVSVLLCSIISASISGEGSETTIPCADKKAPHTGLIWRFNHSQIVLTQTSADVSYIASEQWRQHVKDVSASGSLTLKDLSSAQDGTYTCELSDHEETFITNTFLKMVESQGEVAPSRDFQFICTRDVVVCNISFNTFACLHTSFINVHATS